MRSSNGVARNVLMGFCVVFLFLSVSCSPKNPEIHTTSVQLLRVQGPTGKFAERLSVFVFFTDEDGPSDFSAITITHDESGLVWTIPASSCMTRQRGKDLWTGSNNLAGPGDKPIPLGSYTISVSDLAGNETLSRFKLSSPSFPDYAPVSFTITGDLWSLVRNTSITGFARVWLFLYDDQLNLVYSWRVPDAKDMHSEGTIAMLKTFVPGAVSVQCFAENADGSAGVLLTPVNLE